ncbi:MAG: hypothetical protein LBB68_07050, partial [Treponema sp.]|nr:hypothetical protein [Treponema sp.]
MRENHGINPLNYRPLPQCRIAYDRPAAVNAGDETRQGRRISSRYYRGKNRPERAFPLFAALLVFV